MSSMLAHHPFVFQQRRPGWAIAAVALLHLALIWAVTRPLSRQVEHDGRVWLQLMPPLPQTRGLIAPAKPKPEPAPPLPVFRAAPAITPSAPTTVPAPTPPDDAPPAEPAPETPKAGALTLAEQARQAAGAVDRQLRSEHPQEFTAPPDTPQTRLAKGFAEAHAAVKPKWFEASRIELWSAPNDPKRIYRVITAAGEYCIYMPDKGSMSLNLSARSGHASFGEGRAAPCPIRF